MKKINTKIFAIALILSSSIAYANPAGSYDNMVQLLLPVSIFAIFYFLLIRPQQQKAKKHQEILKSLKKNDQIVTAGGIFATVDKVVNDNEVVAEIADGVKVKILRTSIASVVTKQQDVKKAS